MLLYTVSHTEAYTHMNTCRQIQRTVIFHIKNISDDVI